MATISPAILATELHLREKRQNYTGILDAISLAKQETNAARAAAIGNTVGQIQAGLESLIGVSDNAVEDAESTLAPVIAKVKEIGHGLEKQLHPGITDAEKVCLNAMIKNTAVDISAIFVPAIASSASASKMNHKIMIDASPDAAVTSLKKAAKLIDNNLLKDLIEGLVPDDLKSIAEDAVKKLQSKEVQANITNMLSTIDSELKKTTSGIFSGNLLKDIAEDVSKNLGTTIGNFGDEFTSIKSLPIINDLLGGFNTLGLDKAISTLKIDPELFAKAGSLGIGTNIGGLLDMKGFIKSAEKLAPELQTAITALKTKTDNATTKLNATKTSVASVITDNNTTPHEIADAADTTKDDRFKTLGSIEEIISVLKSSRRDITTVVWHWSGHYLDDGSIGAREIHNEYLQESKKIPYHFVIMKNGDIQTGHTISNASRHVASEWEEFSFGIAFVGGYNGTRDPRGGLVNLDSKSYTRAQWKSFNAFMKAFYTFVPGGDAFGQNDLEDDPGEGPGFDVSSMIGKAPFYRKNACEPGIDSKFLTREEIIAKRIQFAATINELQDIQ